MKVFFTSLTEPEIEVDAWVPRADQGAMLLRGLVETHQNHAVILRARTKRNGENNEVRYIGEAKAPDVEQFLLEVEEMH